MSKKNVKVRNDEEMEGKEERKPQEITERETNCIAERERKEIESNGSFWMSEECPNECLNRS